MRRIYRGKPLPRHAVKACLPNNMNFGPVACDSCVPEAHAAYDVKRGASLLTRAATRKQRLLLFDWLCARY